MCALLSASLFYAIAVLSTEGDLSKSVGKVGELFNVANVMLGFQRYCVPVGGFHPTSTSILKHFYQESKYITQFVSHGALYYVALDTLEEPKEQKEQLNGIAFINQCHIMHLVHRTENPLQYSSRKFMNLLGISLLLQTLFEQYILVQLHLSR